MAFSESFLSSTGLTKFGEKVSLGGWYELSGGRVGVVRFIGKTLFKPGVEWIGLELIKGKGKNNGTVLGTRYFRGKAGKCAFVQINKIEKMHLERYKGSESDRKDDDRTALGKKDVQVGVIVAKALITKKSRTLATGRSKEKESEYARNDEDGTTLGKESAQDGMMVAKGMITKQPEMLRRPRYGTCWWDKLSYMQLNGLSKYWLEAFLLRILNRKELVEIILNYYEAIQCYPYTRLMKDLFGRPKRYVSEIRRIGNWVQNPQICWKCKGDLWYEDSGNQLHGSGWGMQGGDYTYKIYCANDTCQYETSYTN